MVDLINAYDSAAKLGALVAIPHFRRFAGLSQAEFDSRLLKLVKYSSIELHEHDFPSSLTQAQRDEMLCYNGVYYIGFAFRLR